MPALRNEIDALGQNLILQDVRTLSQQMNEALLMLRIVSTLTALFGLLALSLALVGVFSVINYSTSRRTREIGIRLALGAQRADILKMILKEALFIVAFGVGAGLFLSVASGRLIASLMFARGGADMSVYVSVALILIVIAMVACFIPAYKATKVDPTEALRHE
jgi:putative ABC transport system permease protein